MEAAIQNILLIGIKIGHIRLQEELALIFPSRNIQHVIIDVVL